MTRTDYMDGKVDHHTFYLAVADAIGRPELERVVLSLIGPQDMIARKLQTDEHLNNIALARWDGLHGVIQRLVQRKAREVMPMTWPHAYGGPLLPHGTICWSLSESVCVAKTVARQMVEDARKVGV